MLMLNEEKVELRTFPDGTLLLKKAVCMGDVSTTTGRAVIDWRYENDSELFALRCLTRHLQKSGLEVDLFVPYIPNARMDRVKDEEDVFTLKYFAEEINSLGFKNVIVLDPHSSVSEALIDRIKIVSAEKFIRHAIEQINSDDLMMFYPDEGAMKRYSGMFAAPYAFGVKNRYWKTGEILSLELLGEKDQLAGKDVLIVDDICSKGFTFYYAAKALKEHGVRDVYLYVTHCENAILDGKVLTEGLIERVYTTDSICTVDHEKVEVMGI